jgi:hypothetical protein
MQNFTVFYQALKDTNILIYFLANSTNINAVSWLTYQKFGVRAGALDPLFPVSNITTFNFDDNGYVTYV